MMGNGAKNENPFGVLCWYRLYGMNDTRITLNTFPVVVEPSMAPAFGWLRFERYHYEFLQV
jgi:hypothetical protein